MIDRPDGMVGVMTAVGTLSEFNSLTSSMVADGTLKI